MDFIFLDSGTGGLPYMQFLKDSCPEAQCIYLADTKNFPYGEKTPSQIIEAATCAVQSVLAKWTPRAVVLACNTMSVTALPELRKRFSNVPFIGTVPAIKLASSVTKNKRIGLLATNRTVNDSYTDNLKQKFAKDCVLIKRGDAQLIDFIEHKLFDSTKEEQIDAVLPAVDYFIKNNVDTIILGCTHFVNIVDVIQQVAGKDINVIDSRSGVVKQALKVAYSQNKTNFDDFSKPVSDRTFFVTGLQSSLEEEKYEQICKYYNIPWGGIL